MNHIDIKIYKNLINVLEELILTIKKLRNIDDSFKLSQNEREAEEWLQFLKSHKSCDEVKSLENEISNRLFYSFDVSLSKSPLDKKRIDLMKQFISISSFANIDRRVIIGNDLNRSLFVQKGMGKKMAKPARITGKHSMLFERKKH